MPVVQIQQNQQRVNDFLSVALSQITINEPQLHQAMNHGLLLGGKRIRPFLVYAVGEMFGVEKSQLDNAAGAIESIHAYSLIHDDLPAMDDDALRRGQPTCHITFDEATAILAGDSLQTFAFELIGQAPQNAEQRLEMMQCLSKASGYQGMCGGQALDLAATNKQVSLAQLEQIHRLKTGALICAAVELGAIAANASRTHRELLNTFAQNIGLAFQVHDDILDVIGDTETLGKPQGSDEAANKSTYPALLGLESAQDKAKQLIEQAISSLQALPFDSTLLQAFARYIIARNQ
ncbi:(2E,6E)-farnesyl diphosphate synthase [Psychrobium sp. nBUS_13]|uniref:(2E,6E)-farnesyl diphosphate synthase n=1 Tax=Psychrobium sp. nBUS_13 TaxID=3395319 RepID=UPI003EB96514